jgi:UDP-N-acetylmuramoyl-L-alanyl-D-glutamate--2,6-diaminopimelate ligase
MDVLGGLPNKPWVVVDYAHTPDALSRVLRTLEAAGTGELWCVFGCGGDRDRGKRPQMGAVAADLADRIVLTDDNPRSENPAAIVADIRVGIGDHPRVTEIHDRRAAIEHAIGRARPGDVVLIAGKGHEDEQIVGAARRPFNDRLVAAEALGVSR